MIGIESNGIYMPLFYYSSSPKLKFYPGDIYVILKGVNVTV